MRHTRWVISIDKYDSARLRRTEAVIERDGDLVYECSPPPEKLSPGQRERIAKILTQFLREL